MTEIEAQIEGAARAIAEANSIAITAHVRPDGDAIGSVLALGQALKNEGKQVQMVMVDGIPDYLQFLAGTDEIVSRAKKPLDLLIALDCGDAERIGPALDVAIVNGTTSIDINIDHHATNTYFGRINIVEAGAVSTTAILAEHFEALGLTITEPIAEALLTGLLTDTLGFRTSNINPAALRLAADLMELGADLSGIYKKGLSQRTFEAFQYWGAGLSRLERKDGIVWTALTEADRKAIGYKTRDDGDLVNTLSNVTEADIIVIFVEQSPEKVKVSWRSRSGKDVAQIAGQFGGGGHKAAAGAMLEGTLEEVQQKVLEATQAVVAA
ncbi:MAG: hypothetical protein DWQ07_21350 [Chloroflexi bacterium]|nr:MAG: hypothetical protein DWQ07_21350 [Chloroflexota bacterium]MBL1196632.1 hypothetical protein [Chloroflexota bacterium]NOH13925.1 hypothetical protein [Chloroflexota bacterium]